MRRVCFAGLCLAAAFVSPTASARVERIEILSRQAFAPGSEFGPAGAYEKLRGRAFFTLDPEAAANAAIADLRLAPRNERGLVEFSAEFLMLRPTDSARRNGTLLYEVNNRGNIGILGQINEASFTQRSEARSRMPATDFCFAKDLRLCGRDGRPTSPPCRATIGWCCGRRSRAGTARRSPGEVAYELIVDAPRTTARFTGNLGTAYPPATVGAPDAVLTERDRPQGERRPIPRAAWSFVTARDGGPASEIRLAGGIKPGRIYELVYTARDPIVVAPGMAGIRDLMSYLRSNPLAGAPPPQQSLIFGISQSGRLIQTMLLRGLHVDEDGRPVFDGAFIHVAGGGKGGFDYRFAMPTRHFSMLEDHAYPTDFFPFATVAARDPVTGAEGSALDRARALGAVPKLFYVNNSSEYWNRAASLIATDPAGERDLPLVPEARVYLIAGAQHYVGALRERGIFTNCVNTLNHYRAMRALMAALDRWVRDGVEPPPSTYPRIADGTLVTVAASQEAFPRIPNFRLPERNLRPPRLDLGGRFETDRIADQVPPVMGKPFETLVPKPDADGLDQGGIMLPELLVPLGTRTGFNTRSEAAGFPWATGRWDGSFLPFPRTEAERQASGDPRRSLEARYADRAAYEAQDAIGRG